MKTPIKLSLGKDGQNSRQVVSIARKVRKGGGKCGRR